jgi:hypothetical protein
VALWQSWECRGLFADGAVYFLGLILDSTLTFGLDDGPRAHAQFLTQLPVLLAMQLGVTDLHWLARLYSLGLFGVPTALYSFALVRASRDPCVLAATLAAIAAIFVSASILIVGEHNVAYACAVLAAVWLSTAAGLRIGDGLVLAVVAAVATQCYEHYVYLGPLLGLLTVWTIARAAVRPRFATALYGVAAALFVVAGCVAAISLAEMYASTEQRAYLRFMLGNARGFYLNVQLDLLLLAAASVVVWGFLFPDDLRRRRLYLGLAGLPVLLVAASPALVLIDGLIKPSYFSPQASSRSAAGLLAAGFIAFAWLYASGHAARSRALSVFTEPRVARHLVVLAAAMVVATMPWNIMLTCLYARYLDVVRTTIRTQSGLIPIDAAIFERHPRLVVPDIAPATLSLIMRTSPTDGVLVNDERNPADLMDPAAPPDLGRFAWHD